MSNQNAKSCVLTEKGEQKVKEALETIKQKILENPDLKQKFDNSRCVTRGDFNGFFHKDGKYFIEEIVRYIKFAKKELENITDKTSIERGKLSRILISKEAVVKKALVTLFEYLEIDLDNDDWINTNNSSINTEIMDNKKNNKSVQEIFEYEEPDKGLRKFVRNEKINIWKEINEFNIEINTFEEIERDSKRIILYDWTRKMHIKLPCNGGNFLITWVGKNWIDLPYRYTPGLKTIKI